jgi:phosphopantothenoylcysteine synthetase/decarboxylase
MSLEKIVAEAMAGRPLEMKDAFAEEIESRIQDRLEEKYLEIMEAKKAKDEDEDEDDMDDEDDDDMDDEDDDEDEDEDDDKPAFLKKGK